MGLNTSRHSHYSPLPPNIGILGDVVRIAPNRFSVNGLDAVKTILGHGRAFPKSAFYSTFGMPNKTNLFSEPTNAKHAMMRRHLSKLYSTSTLLSYEIFIDSCTSILVEKLREFAKAGKRVHIPDFMQYYAFDVVSEMTVSTSSHILCGHSTTLAPCRGPG